MPHSLVLDLLPKTAIPLSYLKGTRFYGMFLQAVRSRHPTLADKLHQQPGEKAFTLSPLQIELPSRCRRVSDYLLLCQYHHAVAAGTPSWLRVSLLDERLFAALAELWQGGEGNQRWRLGAAEFHVVQVLTTPQDNQPWASHLSYEQIYHQASDQERRIRLAFCTPTMFHEAKYDQALPTRDTVFRGLLRQWNRYAGIPFDSGIVEAIYPSVFDIKTDIPVDYRSQLIGCVGIATFQIMGEVEPEQIRQINALADFALYAGVGLKTALGMGMVRRLENL